VTRRDVSSPDCNFRAIFLITLFVPSISEEEEEEEEALLAVAKRRFFFFFFFVLLLFFLQCTPPRVRKGGERGGENIIILRIKKGSSLFYVNSVERKLNGSTRFRVCNTP
tara:strand:- start:8 stop:337 length:330 start_codon:yes stop_codon:yes gene_type:complete